MIANQRTQRADHAADARRAGGERQSPTDAATARALVLAWTDAFNRRDRDALTVLADPEIAY